AERIGLADDCGERDRGMPDQAVLDLARPDAVAGRGDDVVVAPYEGEIALFVDDALVAGRHPVADELVPRRVLAPPVAQEHHRIGPTHRDLAEFAGRPQPGIAPDPRDRVAGHPLADRAGPSHADRAAAREHEIAFGLAVELVDHEAERRLAPLERLGAERLAAGADRTQPDIA